MNKETLFPTAAELREMDDGQLRALCGHIRSFLIEHVSQTGGHLASNLGVVELTVAIHRVFDTSRDRLVFDVGHQSYVHKLLTGRADRFPTLRQLDGLAGRHQEDRPGPRPLPRRPPYQGGPQKAAH